MSSAISYEYLVSIEGAPNGLATLDGSGYVPASQLPPSAIETYKGVFANETALTTAYPTGSTADYAFVTADLAYFYWNDALVTPAWVNQNITVSNYTALTDAQKAQVPYVIIPDVGP